MPPQIIRQSPAAKSLIKKQASVLDRIAPVSFGQKKDSICLYGVSGTGKTTLACTYPKPLLIIGAEDGTRSVHNVPGVDFVRLRSSLEITDIINMQRSTRKYKTVVLDTVTSLQAQCMAEIMGMDELPTQLSWGFATREQWGQSALQTKDWLRHLLKLAEENVSHTIILAQEKVFGKREGQDTSAADSDVFSPKVMAWITESTVGWLNPACDYICQTYITTKMLKQSTGVKDPKTGQMRMKLVASDDVEYRLRTRAHEFYLIKFRVPKGNTAPPYIADPSYEKIMAVLQGLDAKIKPQVTGGIKAPLPAKPTPKLTA